MSVLFAVVVRYPLCPLKPAPTFPLRTVSFLKYSRDFGYSKVAKSINTLRPTKTNHINHIQTVWEDLVESQLASHSVFCFQLTEKAAKGFCTHQTKRKQNTFKRHPTNRSTADVADPKVSSRYGINFLRKFSLILLICVFGGFMGSNLLPLIWWDLNLKTNISQEFYEMPNRKIIKSAHHFQTTFVIHKILVCLVVVDSWINVSWYFLNCKN